MVGVEIDPRPSVAVDAFVKGVVVVGEGDFDEGIAISDACDTAGHEIPLK